MPRDHEGPSVDREGCSCVHRRIYEYGSNLKKLKLCSLDVALHPQNCNPTSWRKGHCDMLFKVWFVQHVLGSIRGQGEIGNFDIADR